MPPQSQPRLSLRLKRAVVAAVEKVRRGRQPQEIVCGVCGGRENVLTGSKCQVVQVQEDDLTHQNLHAMNIQ